MGVELGARGGDRLLGGALELLTQLDETRTLGLALGLEPLGVGRQALLGLLDQPTLTAGKPVQLVRKLLLCALEVFGPFGESLLDPLLSRPERGAELSAADTFALRNRGAPLFDDPALLFSQHRHRIRPSARER